MERRDYYRKQDEVIDHLRQGHPSTSPSSQQHDDSPDSNAGKTTTTTASPTARVLTKKQKQSLDALAPPNFETMQKLFSSKDFEVPLPSADEIRVPLELYTVVQDKMFRFRAELDDIRRENLLLRRRQSSDMDKLNKMATERNIAEKALAAARTRVEQLSAMNADLLKERDHHRGSATSLDDQMRFAQSEAEDRAKRLATVLAENDDLRSKRVWLEQQVKGLQEDRAVHEKAASSSQSRLKLALMSTAKLAAEKRNLVVVVEEMKNALSRMSLSATHSINNAHSQQQASASPDELRMQSLDPQRRQHQQQDAAADPNTANNNNNNNNNNSIEASSRFGWLDMSFLRKIENSIVAGNNKDGDGEGDDENDDAMATDAEARAAAEDAMLLMMRKAKKVRQFYQQRMETVERKLMEEHDRHSLDEARGAFNALARDFTSAYRGDEAAGNEDDSDDDDDDDANVKNQSARRQHGRAVRALSLFQYQQSLHENAANQKRGDGDGEQEQEVFIDDDAADGAGGENGDTKSATTVATTKTSQQAARQQHVVPIGAAPASPFRPSFENQSDDDEEEEDDDVDDKDRHQGSVGNNNNSNKAASTTHPSQQQQQRQRRRRQFDASQVPLVKSALFRKFFKDPNADEEKAAISAATESILSGVRTAEAMIEYVDQCAAESLSLQDLKDRWEAVKHMARARLTETMHAASAVSHNYTTLLKRRNYFKKGNNNNNSSLLSATTNLAASTTTTTATTTVASPNHNNNTARSLGGANNPASPASPRTYAGSPRFFHDSRPSKDNNANLTGKVKELNEQATTTTATATQQPQQPQIPKVATRNVGISCRIQPRPETAHWCRNTLIQPEDLNEVDGCLFALLPKIYFELHNILHEVIVEARHRAKISLPIADPASFIGDGERRTIADVHCAMKFDLFALMALRDLLRHVGKQQKGTVTTQELRERLIFYKECVESQRLIQLDERFRIDPKLLKRLNIVDRRALQQFRIETHRRFKMPGTLVNNSNDEEGDSTSEVVIDHPAGSRPAPQFVRDTLAQLGHVGGGGDLSHQHNPQQQFAHHHHHRQSVAHGLFDDLLHNNNNSSSAHVTPIRRISSQVQQQQQLEQQAQFLHRASLGNVLSAAPSTTTAVMVGNVGLFSHNQSAGSDVLMSSSSPPTGLAARQAAAALPPLERTTAATTTGGAPAAHTSFTARLALMMGQAARGTPQTSRSRATGGFSLYSGVMRQQNHMQQQHQSPTQHVAQQQQQQQGFALHVTPMAISRVRRG